MQRVTRPRVRLFRSVDVRDEVAVAPVWATSEATHLPELVDTLLAGPFTCRASDGDMPNISLKALLKWDELLNPTAKAISVICK
jgi:hypothetical protein